MSYLETLRKRRVSPRAVEHTLRISIGSGKYQFFLIVEGEEDEEYYSVAMEGLRPEAVFQTIVCDGKGGVLGLRDFADTEFSKNEHIYYFIDRDHDDFIGIDNSREDTYVTDGYSVEWELCSRHVLSSVFQKNFVIAKSDALIPAFDRFCDDRIGSVMTRFRSVMALVIVVRQADHDPDLDRLTLNGLFEFSRDSYVRKRLSLADLIKLMDCDAKVEPKAVRHMLRCVRSTADNAFVRGKMMMSLYCDLLARFSTVAGHRKANGRALRARVQVGKKNFIHLALEAARLPDSLRLFLEKVAI